MSFSRLSRKKMYASEVPGDDSQHHRSAMLRGTRLEAIREANRREGRQKKSPQRRLYYYENTAQVRRTPYSYEAASSDEDRPSVELLTEPESDKLPAVRRAPYLFADDTLRQGLAQQINPSASRRFARLVASQYSDDDDDFFLEPEQIDKELPSLHTDEHPEIPRVRRASARYRNHARRRAVVQNYIYSLPNMVMRNKKRTYFTIGMMLFVITLTILLLAPLDAEMFFLMLTLIVFALLALVAGFAHSNYRKK
jgi:hypothetical protein